jgi:hypothetical protein
VPYGDGLWGDPLFGWEVEGTPPVPARRRLLILEKRRRGMGLAMSRRVFYKDRAERTLTKAALKTVQFKKDTARRVLAVDTERRTLNVA